MRKLILVLIVLAFAGVVSADTDIGPPGPSEVLIGPNGVIMPLGRILLVRKDSKYCAIKFIKFRTGKTKKDLYANYESYSPRDNALSFPDNNVSIYRDELHAPEPKWSLFGHPVVLFGENNEIRCSSLRLWWTGTGAVYLFGRGQHQRDYGIEFGPTPWTDVSHIDLSDPRIRWYRYDGYRKSIKISIEQIWEVQTGK